MNRTCRKCPQTQPHVHAPPQGFIRKYVFSLDHKVIGLQYYGLGLAAVILGMVLSWLMRFHLVWPTPRIPGLELISKVGAPGGIITPEYYLSLLTMHGTLMVFFVLTNAPFAAFGNYFLPIQIGAEDMAFPRFNMMSFWTTFAAFIVLVLRSSFPTGRRSRDGPLTRRLAPWVLMPGRVSAGDRTCGRFRLLFSVPVRCLAR